jgi:CTP:molybdopterin cytidylyltransferase MocA/SAM-dependent methyltransferase
VIDRTRIVPVVLAAGRSTRFGASKLTASLDGRAVIAHVLEAVDGLGLAAPVVVVGSDGDAIRSAVAAPTAQWAINPRPEDGLSSSVKLGLEVASLDRDAVAALILLGDQPLVRRAVIEALLAAEVPEGTVAIAPRYGAGGGANPVLLLRDGWPLAAETSGDRGLGPVLAAQPELVAWVEVDGDNPDVDTPADLAAAAWAALVRADHEQVDRLREVPDATDFYGPVSSLFRSDPRRTDDPQLAVLLPLAQPGETWLDIGAGAGRFALPLALAVREVVALDPSAGMLEALREGMAAHGIANIRIIEARWPMPADEATRAGVGPGSADVTLMAHLGYDVEAIGPFVDAMEAAARRCCVAVLMDRQPSSVADPCWPPVHGEPRVRLPALREFVALLRARGRDPVLTETPRPARGFESRDELERFVRRQLWVAEGSAKDARFRAVLPDLAVERDGRWELRPAPGLPPAVVGVVVWDPRPER